MNSKHRGKWIVVLIAVLAVATFLPNAGKLLVVDEPAKSDVILVLTGDIGDIRLARALQLFRNGDGKQLILDAPDWRMYGRTLSALAQENLQRETLGESDRVRVCSFHRDSTIEELSDVRTCVHQFAPNAHSAIIVTFDYHTHRALAIARKVFPEYTWTAAAARDERFGVSWWQHREWAKTTLLEWERLIWWTCVEQWKQMS